ncbi:HlyIII-domain-containing protein [Staphylotrichum tortipilum]|uniref:HlyIII-domain-containing protein n=1 Tax=Staphylotrichum tortipilum TaxID=2831512 RepID=A0AAN6MQ87_9PEZI|nr:HlyIII-domain-containing protein [Staphylotrichum longicolle]
MGISRRAVTPSATPLKLQATPESKQPSRLLSITQIPSWYADPFILTGYRPVTPSVKSCFGSLGYLHNETANIYSHLIPALCCIVLAALVSGYFRATFPRATRTDRLVFEIYLATSVLCFTVSSFYHTLLCHSRHYRDLWVRFDYLTIVVQILGSFVSGIYVGFYCEPRLQQLYWSMIVVLSVATAFVVIHPSLQSPRHRGLRTGTFVATGLSAFAPIVHAASIFPYQQLDQQAGLRYYYLEGVILIAGAVVYITRFPEARRPGKFDIWGSSHQIFHLLVVQSAAVHLYGILGAFRWNYENLRCQNTGALGYGDLLAS